MTSKLDILITFVATTVNNLLICSLLAGVNHVLEACGYSEAANINTLQLPLYGNKNLPLEANKIILNVTVKYISEKERFG